MFDVWLSSESLSTMLANIVAMDYPNSQLELNYAADAITMTKASYASLRAQELRKGTMDAFVALPLS